MLTTRIYKKNDANCKLLVEDKKYTHEAVQNQILPKGIRGALSRESTLPLIVEQVPVEPFSLFLVEFNLRLLEQSKKKMQK